MKKHDVIAQFYNKNMFDDLCTLSLSSLNYN